MNITTILIPTRPQVDTMVAMFLLKTFGKERFPGIETAQVEVKPALPENKTLEKLLDEGIMPLDIGGGEFDHHGKELCVTELVVKYLNIEKDPSLKQLLAWTLRDEKQGKGTLSRDPLDRAFGLQGLIAALNKVYPEEPRKVVAATLPMLEAHWRAAHQHHVEHPREVEEKRKRGDYQNFTVKQGDKMLKVAYVVSDKPTMPTFLRSEAGGRFEVVLQKMEKASNYCVLTNQKRGIDLSRVAGLVRLREAELKGIELADDENLLKSGRIDDVPNWYYDPMTNSVLNGGVYSRDVEPSKIPVDEMIGIVKTGLELGGK